MLTRDLMQWFWRHYIKDESEANHPYDSPLQANTNGPVVAKRKSRFTGELKIAKLVNNIFFEFFDIS